MARVLVSADADQPRNSPAADRPEPVDPGLEGPPEPRSRYRLHGEEEPHVDCVNAGDVRLHVERGLVVDEAGRRRYDRQTVFLDGVFSAAPFLDNENRQYSLDHHAGCVRAFTLATCEQAAVMLLSGMPLAEGTWRLYVNEPDLDAVLAAWLLINHAELTRDGARLLREVMPLVRVEGVIDGHGLDMGLLAGLPQEEYERWRQQADALRARELELKSGGRWAESDPLAYSCELLTRLDQALFPPGFLDALLEISELGRIEIKGEKLAVLCHSRQGIYAVEAHLKQRYEKQLGLILLDQGDRFTLRQVDSFLPRTLEDLYGELNHRDPAVTGDDPDNRWGGSADIGGSPRGSGTELSGDELLRIVGAVYGDEGWLKRFVKRIKG